MQKLLCIVTSDKPIIRKPSSQSNTPSSPANTSSTPPRNTCLSKAKCANLTPPKMLEAAHHPNQSQT